MFQLLVDVFGVQSYFRGRGKGREEVLGEFKKKESMNNLCKLFGPTTNKKD